MAEHTERSIVNVTTGNAMDALKNAIQRDEEYAYGWHANIAMSLYDAMPTNTFWMPDKSKFLDIANDAATVFMSRTFDVKTSQDMLLIN